MDSSAFHSLREILARVERRLRIVGISADAASVAAGKKDAIRNLQRAAKSGREGVSTATLFALAPILETTPGWLIDGSGSEQVDASVARVDLQAGFTEAIRLLGHHEPWLNSYVQVVIAMVEAPADHAGQEAAERVEREARRFLKDRRNEPPVR